MGKLIVLTGQKFGRLTVLDRNEEATSKFSRIFYNCVCDCGKEKVCCGNNLKAGSIRSCGCLRNELNTLKHSKPREVVDSTVFYTRCVLGSKKRNMKLELDRQYFIDHLNDECFYCGDNSKPHGYDRLDSSKGYTLTNTVTCCYICNRAKSDLSLLEFLSYLDRLSTFKEKPCERINKKLNEI